MKEDSQIAPESEYETAGTAEIIEEISIQNSTEIQQNDAENKNGTIITHKGFASDSEKQLMVQKAFELGGLDFVSMIECENGNRNPLAVGDGGHAYGLCQMNSNYHDIPQQYYEDRGFQIEYCYQKRSTGTKFYGPGRKIKGMKCSEYVKDRFIFNN